VNTLLELLEASPRLSVDTIHNFEGKTPQECISLFAKTAKSSGWSENAISQVLIEIVVSGNPVSIVSDLFDDAVLISNTNSRQDVFTEDPDEDADD